MIGGCGWLAIDQAFDWKFISWDAFWIVIAFVLAAISSSFLHAARLGHWPWEVELRPKQ